MAARHSVTLLSTACSRQMVDIVARRIHASQFTGVAPFVGLKAGSFPRDAEQLRTHLVKPIHAATGGSLLIRDVEEMSSAAQLTFASILSEGSLGHPAAVRLIAGTTVSLLERVDAGYFLEELFYRLNLIHLVIAPDEIPTDAYSPSRLKCASITS